DFTHGLWRDWIVRARELAPRHLQLHSMIDQDRWTEEFSRYDAGWLHVFESSNRGELHRANWDDLNLPARMATLAAGGLPMIQRDNRGSIVAAQALAERLGVGIGFRTPDELGAALRAEVRDRAVSTRVRDARDAFTFDAHADRLVGFLRGVVDRRTPRVVPAIRALGGGRRRETKLQDARGRPPGRGASHPA
ncbi:MAG: hypothetical protein ACJ77B_05285, partial [Chloroflexota bacterium]